MSERCERTSEWPTTYVPITGLSEPGWKGEGRHGRRGNNEASWVEAVSPRVGKKQAWGELDGVGKMKTWKNEKNEVEEFEEGEWKGGINNNNNNNNNNKNNNNNNKNNNSMIKSRPNGFLSST